MKTTLLFVIAATTMVLQLCSRNLFFAIISFACIVAMVALGLYHLTRRWYFIIPSLVVNCKVVADAIKISQNLNTAIYDYILCAIIILLVSALTIIEVLPNRNGSPRKGAVRFYRAS